MKGNSAISALPDPLSWQETVNPGERIGTSDTILHHLNPESLMIMLRQVVRSEVSLLVPKREPVSYKTRKEACAVLHVTLPTLGNYINRGIIRAVKVGRRVLIEEAEINRALQEMPSLRYSRTGR
jgi:excisionase family DNA binding protein